MPTAVANKMKLAKGEGRLLEPEEFDKLKEEGYMETQKPKEETDPELEALMRTQSTPVSIMAERAVEEAVREAEFEMMAVEAAGGIKGVASEAALAENKLHHVEMEEVEDEDM